MIDKNKNKSWTKIIIITFIVPAAYGGFLLPEKYILFERFNNFFSPCHFHKEKKNEIFFVFVKMTSAKGIKKKLNKFFPMSLSQGEFLY